MTASSSRSTAEEARRPPNAWLESGQRTAPRSWRFDRPDVAFARRRSISPPHAPGPYSSGVTGPRSQALRSRWQAPARARVKVGAPSRFDLIGEDAKRLRLNLRCGGRCAEPWGKHTSAPWVSSRPCMAHLVEVGLARAGGATTAAPWPQVPCGSLHRSSDKKRESQRREEDGRYGLLKETPMLRKKEARACTTS